MEKGIDDSGDFYERTVNGNTYSFIWTDDGELKPYGEEYFFSGSIIDGDCDIQAYID